jgi:membrane protein involved in colicin uptake
MNGLLLQTSHFYYTTVVTKNGSLTSSGYMLAEDRNAAHNATSREEELRQVRLRQQEIASERAKQAAIERKIKDNKERERKNNVAKKKHMQGGNKLGGGKNTASATGDACAYTPLQPSSAQSRGYRYVINTIRMMV